MASPFKIYRILCSTPPELDPERTLFESSLAAFGEKVTFPEQILFAGASFRDGFDAGRHRGPAEANVRLCDFFVHIYGETWPGPTFRDFIKLAIGCIEDPSKPMRQAAVLFKNPTEADEKVRQVRQTLIEEGKCAVLEFRDSAELEAQLKQIYACWYASVKERP